VGCRCLSEYKASHDMVTCCVFPRVPSDFIQTMLSHRAVFMYGTIGNLCITQHHHDDSFNEIFGLVGRIQWVTAKIGIKFVCCELCRNKPRINVVYLQIE